MSLAWPVCGRPGCGRKHLPEYDCPGNGVWLIRRFCPGCRGGTYCLAHRPRGITP